MVDGPDSLALCIILLYMVILVFRYASVAIAYHSERYLVNKIQNFTRDFVSY